MEQWYYCLQANKSKDKMQKLNLQHEIQKKLRMRPVFYATRDGERALSLEEYDKYFIVSNDSPLIRNKKNVIKLTVNHDKRPLSTREILHSSSFEDSLNEISEDTHPYIVVFKNTTQIERECIKNGWKLLNPQAKLVDLLETKISQYNWMKNCGLFNAFLIPSHTGTVEDLEDRLGESLFESDNKYIVQFNHGHTGLGTKFLKKKEDLEDMLEKFPKREVKISNYIEGLVYTINIVLYKNGDLYFGNPSLQITGIDELTDYPFSTVGNDWSFVRNETVRKAITDHGGVIGLELAKEGWFGMFGLDFIWSSEEEKLYLIEINARQPASAVCESYIQQRSGIAPAIMERHLGSLLNIGSTNFNSDSVDYLDGAQVFVRRKGARSSQSLNSKISIDLEVGEYSFEDGKLEFIKPALSLAEIEDNNFFIFPQASGRDFRYNDELVRVQSPQGMVNAGGTLKERVIGLIRVIREKIIAY